MIQFSIKAFLIVIVLFGIFDGIWLGLLMNKFYMGELDSIAKKVEGKFAPNIFAALAVYLLLAFGITIFIAPQLNALPIWQIGLLGSILGAVAYGVYDFTNLATLGAYSLKLALVDFGWGIFATGAVSAALKLISGFIKI